MSRRGGGKVRHDEPGDPQRPPPGPPPRKRADPKRLLRRAAIALLIAAVATVAWRALRYSLPGPLGATTIPAPREAPPVSKVARADFVGAEACAGCHKSEYDAWAKSTHGRAGGEASPGVVIAAFNGTPIRFRDAVVTPRIRDGAYEFVVAPDDDSTQVIRVDGVIGGGHMEGGGTQGFVTKRADGTLRFVPFDWSRHGSTWFCNTNSRAARGWVPISESMRLSDCGDWPPARVLGDLPRWANCQGCHASQLTVSGTGAGRTTQMSSLAINCESCHGPARRHVKLAESGALKTGTDLGLASLRTLGKDASLNTCFQCHSVKDQLREGFVSGDSLEIFYSLKLPLLGDRPLHPDGRVRTFAYQESHRFSDCYVNGGMTCTSCHDPHTQGYRTVSGDALPGRFDDRQCTSCHASKAERPTEHTHHADGSPGSRCTACHMPYLKQPETLDPRTGRALVQYSRADHSIAIPRPHADSLLGVATACAACHAAKSTTQLATEARTWWAPMKSVNNRVIRQLVVDRAQREFDNAPTFMAGGPAVPLDSARSVLISPDVQSERRHIAATAAGLARYLESIARPDSVVFGRGDRQQLNSLARDEDVDVRALALAALHLARGADAQVRRTLATAAWREGSHDFSLRSRWAVALGYMGDRYAGAGDLAAARVAYGRALEVTPDNAAILRNLGNAERNAGYFRAAITSYERALALEPRAALTMVNLGIALGAAGDSARGVAMFQRATETDPGEPLGWFNLGNAVVLRGDFAAAKRYFRAALAIDGALTEAHFQLARIHLIERDGRSALSELRRGLAVDSSNAAARALARELAMAQKP